MSKKTSVKYQDSRLSYTHLNKCFCFLFVKRLGPCYPVLFNFYLIARKIRNRLHFIEKGRIKASFWSKPKPKFLKTSSATLLRSV